MHVRGTPAPRRLRVAARRLRPAALAAAALIALPGCSAAGTAGTAEEVVLTGWEFGNPQDQADVRQDRPGYRPWE